MRLLISVADADEARAAVDGGADIVDAKDPAAGALGAVSAESLRAIAVAVGGARALSAALGDAAHEEQVEHAARRAAAQRLAYLKVGFAGIGDPSRVEELLAAAVRGAQMVSPSSGVVAVAYADADRVGTIAAERVIEAAERAGAIGVLLDTAVKDGRGLFDVLREREVARWIALAHAAALTAAVAGRLGGAQLATARALGADVAGVRGAACEGGRTGRVSRDRVAALVAAIAERRTGTGPHALRRAPVIPTQPGATVTLPAELP